MTTPHIFTQAEIFDALNEVKDPEIPVISVVEMGMISLVEISDEGSVKVTMTPTFVGCPAIGVIKKDIAEKLAEIGIEKAEVLVDYETAWNSNRMTNQAKDKLEKFGLAPPAVLDGELTEAQLNSVRCPHCHSTDTTLRSSFGSTLCRAIRFCFNCKQGFEQFKPVG